MLRSGALRAVVLQCMMAVACGTAWAAGPAAEIHIREYRFEPAELTVKAGTTVRWLNAEKRTSHSILFPGEDGFESERIFPGEHWERRFDVPGVHVYGCGPHPEMRGTLVVEE